MNNLCLILGAGASYDCLISDIVSPKNPHFRPPLTKDIFSPSFDELLEKYPKASTLAVELRLALKSGQNSLEGLLRKEQEKASPTRLKQIRQVPLYLRELFGRVKNNYVDSAKTCYAMLISKICDNSFDKIMVINLNYDTLFEEALKSVADIEFRKINDYFEISEKWKVFKPHGSANWIRKVVHDGEYYEHGKVDLSLIDSLAELKYEERIHIYDIPVTAIEKKFAYPCMVIPVEGKYEFCCPKEHVQEAEKLLSGCGAFLTIGYSFKDEDVNNLLKQHVKNTHRVEIVDMLNDTSSPHFWQFREKISNLFGNNYFNNGGFSGFIASGACDKYFDELKRTVSNIFWNKVPLN